MCPPANGGSAATIRGGGDNGRKRGRATVLGVGTGESLLHAIMNLAGIVDSADNLRWIIYIVGVQPPVLLWCTSWGRGSTPLEAVRHRPNPAAEGERAPRGGGALCNSRGATHLTSRGGGPRLMHSNRAACRSSCITGLHLGGILLTDASMGC
jgi:hypothetical protein